MLKRKRLTTFAICASIFFFISTSLLSLKPISTSTNPSASQRIKALLKHWSCFCGDEVFRQSNETVIGDISVLRQNETTTTQNSSDYAMFRLIQTSIDRLVICYHRLLTSTEWKLNSTRLDKFRQDLFKSTNLTGQGDFLLTQQNTRDGNRLVYCYSVINAGKKASKFYYTVTKEFLETDVPKVSPLSGRMFPRCSVVGNSGILANSKCGQEIDQADYVIRSNLPPIRPHAVDGGWKSNMTTMNPSISIKRFKKLKVKKDVAAFSEAVNEYSGLLWLPCMSDQGSTDICLKVKHTLELSKVQNLKAAIGDPRHFIAVYDFWKERKLTRFPSTGFYMTNLALTMCEETHLYGFWPFPSAVQRNGTNTMRKVKYHYFDDLAENSVHSMDDEFAVLLQMHRVGLLNLHVNDCVVKEKSN